MLTVSGPNIYTGPTTVQAGTLRIDGNNSAATGDVNVTGGVLAGTGTVGGQNGGGVTASAGAAIAPGGAAALGTLTTAAGSNVSFNSGSSLNVRLGANAVNGSSDKLAAGGFIDLNADGGANLSLKLSPLGFTGTAGGPATYIIATAGGTGFRYGSPEGIGGTQGTYTHPGQSVGGVTLDASAFTNLTTGDTFTLGVVGNSLVLTYTPVPEPVTVLAMGAIGLLVGRRLRRKAV